MPLCSLPNELILSIAGYLQVRDIYSLIVISRRFSHLLSRSLRAAAADSELANRALWWAVLSNDRAFAKCILENGEAVVVARTPEEPDLPDRGPRDVVEIPMFVCECIRWSMEDVFHRAPSKCDDTALDWIMQQGTRLLLKKPGTIEGHDGWFTNPHDYAIRTRHHALLKLSLYIGDREQPYPQLGRMPKSLHALAHIIQAADQELAEIALCYINDTHGPEMYQMALDMALIKTIKPQYTEMAKFLLARGADPNVGADIEGHTLTPNDWNDSGQPALHRAVQYSSTEIVAIFLANGANANIPCPRGYTPLMKVSSRSRTSAVPCALLLLDNGADINSKTHNGATVLMANASNGDGALVEFLLKNGAAMNINACNNSGNTALHVAVISCRETSDFWRRGQGDPGKGITRHEVVIRLLLKNGADVSIQDPKGMSPLDLLIKPWGGSVEWGLTAPEKRIVGMLKAGLNGHFKKSYASKLVSRLLGNKRGTV